MRVECNPRGARAAGRRSVTPRAYGVVSYAVVSIVDAVVEHPLGLDADDQAVDRRVERLAVVALRKLADVLVRALLVQLDRAFDLEVPVGILVVPDADADARVRAEVPALGALVRRVEDDVLAVGVDPDDARLRAAVLTDRGDYPEVMSLQDRLLLVAQLCHARPSVIVPRRPACAGRRGPLSVAI